MMLIRNEEMDFEFLRTRSTTVRSGLAEFWSTGGMIKRDRVLRFFVCFFDERCDGSIVFSRELAAPVFGCSVPGSFSTGRSDESDGILWTNGSAFGWTSMYETCSENVRHRRGCDVFNQAVLRLACDGCEDDSKDACVAQS